MKTKKIILCAFFSIGIMLVSNQCLKAQSLQFSQVILLSNTVAAATLDTVPSGKVWKVVSFGGNTVNAVRGTINGVNAGILGYYHDTTPLYLQSWRTPVWLPAETSIGYTGNVSPNIVWLSIIEFNIVP